MSRGEKKERERKERYTHIYICIYIAVECRVEFWQIAIMRPFRNCHLEFLIFSFA